MKLKIKLRRPNVALHVQRLLFTLFAISALFLLALFLVPAMFSMFVDINGAVNEAPGLGLGRIAAYPTWVYFMVLSEVGLYGLALHILVSAPFGRYDKAISQLFGSYRLKEK